MDDPGISFREHEVSGHEENGSIRLLGADLEAEVRTREAIVIDHGAGVLGDRASSGPGETLTSPPGREKKKELQDQLESSNPPGISEKETNRLSAEMRRKAQGPRIRAQARIPLHSGPRRVRWPGPPVRRGRGPVRGPRAVFVA